MVRTADKPNESAFLPHLVTRRSLLAGLGGAGILAASGLTARSQQATPDASPDASPAASPAASPEALPAVLATPVAEPPEMIGKLRVVRDQRPVYSTRPTRGGTLTMVRVGRDNLEFNPAALIQDFQIPGSYLEPLVWIDGVTMEPQPWLASEWSWNKDRTEIEYTLRDDVKWHDGESLTARDVAFSFLVYRDDIYSAVYALFTNMESVEAIDSRTVRVRLSTPDANWIRNASSQLIFQREQYGKFWDNQVEGQRSLSGFNSAESRPVGTGQWVVNEFNDRQVIFKRNRSYWGNSARMSEFRLDFVDDQATQLTRWHEGVADIVWPIAPRDLESVSDRPGTVYAAETTTTMFAAFNFDNPSRPDPGVLGDLRIRQALSLGIDRNRYARELFSGFFRPDVPGTILQPDLLLEGIRNPEFDPRRAQELLKEAGFAITRDDGLFRYPEGSALKFDVIVRSGDNPELAAVLTSAAADLRTVGVLLEIRELSPERFEGVWINDHAFDLIAFSYSLYSGFTDFDLYGSAWDIRTNIQGFNPGGYRNDKVDRAIARLLEAPGDDEYRSALRAIQRQANLEDLFALWLGSPLDAILVQDKISGYRPNKLWQGLESSKIWRDK